MSGRYGPVRRERWPTDQYSSGGKALERNVGSASLRTYRDEIRRVATGVKRMLAALLAAAAAAQTPNNPQCDISNGILKAHLYLPDAQTGYYRGSRFDWSGVVSSLTFKNHEFFGQWFSKYDPLLHDAIMGPVEEFRSEDGALRYTEAKPGKLFLKIGVGLLRKLDDTPYNFARTYPLVVPGKRIVRVEADRVEFVHELNNGEGYAYSYKKTVMLPRKKAQLLLLHSLTNTGKLAIDTSLYNHDFYMLDHQPTGPDFRVRFPFEPKVDQEFKEPGRIEGHEIRYERELTPQPESVHGYITGYGDDLSDSEVRVENVKTGIGVRETVDKPVSKLYFWSIHTTVCPEIYIKMHVEPGETFKWKTTYDFYLLNQSTGTKRKATGEGT